ncbi:hypothetical protein Bhyg_13837 [Pseudolycoriella hygida]|uniref:Uncharacterized protein n=1 Tax=Pseudolycoriella hygida TaxID=35572 RepID=A0A9Q0MNT3_9DIPT|nr:hypothetical protein Bhyg_13837 [Pseudolycoriella hygida]
MNQINCCISGGYVVYRAGFSSNYTDVDIFIDGHNFDETSFLEWDNEIRVVPKENYVHVGRLRKRFTITTTDEVSNMSNKIDFIIWHCDIKTDNNHMFSELVTSEFDIDVCRTSIIMVEEECRMVFNSNFKLFIRNETQEFQYVTNENKAHCKRFLKYVKRLKPCYRLFFSSCAPSFDIEHLMRFRELTLERNDMCA